MTIKRINYLPYGEYLTVEKWVLSEEIKKLFSDILIAYCHENHNIYIKTNTGLYSVYNN